MERRTFLKGVVGALGLALFNEIYGNSIEADWMKNPNQYTFEKDSRGLAAKYDGNIVNMPMLWQRATLNREPYITKAASVAHHVRILLGNSIEERTLGNFNDNALIQVNVFSRELERRNLGVMIDLIDGFTLRDSWNGVYGRSLATSVYSAEGEDQFYKADKYQQAFLRRVDRIGKQINKIPNLTAVTLGNELRAPTSTDGQEVFLNWYDRMASAVKNVLPDTPLFTGVADPRSITRGIKGIDANTIHFYQLGINYAGLSKYIAASTLPIVVQEFGVPETYLGINYHFDLDDDWRHYLRKILSVCSTVDDKQKKVRLAITGLGVWKMDAYNDGYNFDPEKMPKTSSDLMALNEILTRRQPLKTNLD